MQINPLRVPQKGLQNYKLFFDKPTAYRKKNKLAIKAGTKVAIKFMKSLVYSQQFSWIFP